jgi:hypothetical protein
MAQAFIAKVNVWPLKITVTDDIKKRSLPANAQPHVWFSQISKETGEDTHTLELKHKLSFGLPILLNSDKYGEAIANDLDKKGFFDWQYGEQVANMVFLNVTSLFTTQEHKLYRDIMQSYWRENGMILEYK